MTDITDWDQFAEEVQKRCQDVFDKVWGELNRMAGVLNDAASHFDWVGVLFPIPKLIWDGLTSDDVERAIDKFNNEIRPQLEKKAQEVVGDITKVVGTLAGDPPGLKKLSFDYARAGRSSSTRRPPSSPRSSSSGSPGRARRSPPTRWPPVSRSRR